MSNVVNIIVTSQPVTALSGFALVRLAARRMAASVQSSVRSAGNEINRRVSTITSVVGRGFSAVGQFTQRVVGQVMELAGSLREVGSAAALSIGKIGGMTAVVVHLLPQVLDLLGVIQLLAPAIVAGGVAMGVFKMATSGLSEVISAGLEGDVEEFNKGMKKLPKSAREFVTAIIQIRDKLKPLQKQVQSNFFDGIGKGIKGLVDTYFPSLNRWLPRISTSFNNMFKEMIAWLKLPEQVGDVEGILRNVASIIDSALGLVKPFASIFMDVTAVAAPRLASIMNTTTSLAEKAAAWIDKMRESGKLGEWLDKAIDGFTEIRGIVADLGAVIGSLYSGASTEGETFLEGLHKQTTALKEWAASANGQQAISDLSAVGGAILQFGVIVLQAIVGWTYALRWFYERVNEVILKVLDFVSTMLNAAAKVEKALGFGTVLQNAARDFEAFRDRANQALGEIEDESVIVNVVSKLSGNTTIKNSLSGKATGGWATGVKKVGERGTELIDFGAGARVYNNGDSRQMMANAGSSKGTPGTMTIIVGVKPGSDPKMAQFIKESLTFSYQGDLDSELAGSPWP